MHRRWTTLAAMPRRARWGAPALSTAAAAASSSPAVREGGCATCGVRLRLSGAPAFTAVCHCSVCKAHGVLDVASGAPIAGGPSRFVGWDPSNFEVLRRGTARLSGGGGGKFALANVDGGSAVDRYFCGCGERLFARMNHLDAVVVFAEVLDEPVPMERHIFCGGGAEGGDGGAELEMREGEEGLPRFAELPPEWSAGCTE